LRVEQDEPGAREIRETSAKRLDDELARTRLGEEALQEDLALRDQGQEELAVRREWSEREGPLDSGHLPGERVGLVPRELAVGGEGDHGREIEDTVGRAILVLWFNDVASQLSRSGRADWPHAADAGRGTGLRGEVERRTNGFLAIELNRLGDASPHS
jgi:hypothetical protein